MTNPDPREPAFLEYSSAKRDRHRTGATEYWGVYTPCALVGVFVLQPWVAVKLFGHPGDEGVGFFVLLSAGFATLAAGVLHRMRLRRSPPTVALFAAAVLGFTAFVPGYVILFLLF